MNYSRRKFIYTSSLAYISLFIASPFVRANKILDFSLQNEDLEKLLIRAAQARKSENLELSESIYKQIITLYPKDERAYFGLRKLFLFQNRKVEVLQLLEKSIKVNPTNPSLIAQLAKEYSSIALGNKKLEKELNYNFSLLKKSKELYEQSTSLINQSKPETRTLTRSKTTTNSNAEIGLMRIDKKINSKAGRIDARDNPSLKQTRKENRVTTKAQILGLSESELIAKLNTLLAKPSHNDRNKKIKRLYIALIRKYKKEKRTSDQFNYALLLYNFDKKDPYSLYLIKKSALKDSQYSTLDTILKENTITQNTAWSRLAYIDFLLLKSRKTSQVDLHYLKNLIDHLDVTYSLIPNLKIEKSFREIEYSLMTKDFSTTKKLLLIMASDFIGTNSQHNMVTFSKYFSSYFILTGNNETATLLVNQLLNPANHFEYTDELAIEIGKLISLKSIKIEKEHHIKDLITIKKHIQTSQSYY
ncbi:hypothetical protein [Chishuiella changwenlii]|uniref:tetratricopeptide repeat protein n=1 Tax=Chishuiella changwenlii TaxID=1434701 RepID=UPI002FD9546D